MLSIGLLQTIGRLTGTCHSKGAVRAFLAFFLLTTIAFAQFPQSVLPGDLQSHFGLQGLPASSKTVVPVEGMPFGWAWRLHTPANTETRAWEYAVPGKAIVSVNQGDFLLATFWMRTISTAGESGLVQFICQVDADPYTKSVTWIAPAGPEWTKVEIPFRMADSYRTGEWSVQFWITFPEQTIEIGGLSVVNHGPGKTWRDFNLESYPYRGQEADAAWRAAAAERIERYRKGDIVVVARDSEGNALENAPVRVRMKNHAFRWGAAVSASYINDPAHGKYRDSVLETFNSVTIENALKWRQWDRDRSYGIQAADWARGQGLSVRGHNIVWPGWRHLPDWLQGQQDNPAQLRQTVRDHVTDISTATRGKLIDWDVINEPHTNRDLQNILGEEEMAEWFRLARLADPEVKLYLNDYSIISSGGWDIAHQAGYRRIIELLDSLGAPVEGLGLQGHFQGRLTDPERALAILDRFANYGKDLLITEFDIDTDDEQLQADYTRDFLTTVFSHPAVKGFYTWVFWAGKGWQPRAAMYREDWSRKPNGDVWHQLVFNDWWTDVRGVTGRDGLYRTRGFLGDYEVEVGSETRTLSTTDPAAPTYALIGEQIQGSIAAGGVLNAASFRAGPVAPGEIVTVYGNGFGAPELRQAAYVGGQLPTHTGDTRVLFDGVPAPMVYSLDGQISTIVPYSVSGSTAVEVEYLGTKSAPVILPVASAAPGVFCYAAGRGQAVAVNNGVTFNGPEAPVERGGILTFFLTGEGAVTPTIRDGRLPSAPDFPVPVHPLRVYVSGRECPIEFVGLVYAGVTQVNVRVPDDSLTGETVSLQVVVDGVASPDDVTIAVR